MVFAYAVFYAVSPFRAQTLLPTRIDSEVPGDITSSPIAGNVTVTETETLATSGSCGAAVVDAWHAKVPSGWFGYAPLTATPLTGSTCRGVARHRLRVSFLAVVLALGLWLAARVADRGPGLDFGGAPNPAT